MNEADLKIPEGRFQKRIKRESVLITLGLHAGVLALLAFATCAAPTEPPEELTEITWGGSGGSPEVQAPEAPAMRGTPQPVPRPVEKSRPKAEPEKIKAPQTKSPSAEKIPATSKEPKRPAQPSTPNTTQANDPPRTPSTPSTEGPKTPANNTNAPPGQQANGTGDRPAGGSGSKSSGYSVSGLGSRGMVVGPGARYPQGSSATGTVTLRFTVLPNGSITSITPVKRADQALVNAAMAGLRKAKFRPLPENAPQAPQTGTITYRFELK